MASGSVDIGFVGTRTWAGQDVHAFDALQAPFLMGDYELQQAVLESGVIDETDDSLESLGLVSLGILPGPLRVAAGREGPYLGAADYVGAKIGMSDAAITEATLRALGASPVPILLGADSDGVDGIEAQVGAMRFEGAGGMRFVTGNVVLWPRPISVVMNAERFAGLTPDQQTWLREAVGNSMDEMTDRSKALDRQSVDNACRNGAQFVDATHRTWPGSARPWNPCTATCGRTRRRAAPSTRSMRSAARIGLTLACQATAGASGTPAASAPELVDSRGWHLDCVRLRS